MRQPLLSTLVATLTAIGCGSQSASTSPRVSSPDGEAPIDSGATALDAGATLDGALDDRDAGGDGALRDTGTVPVAACNGIAVGTWQNVTPPQLDMANWCSVNFSTCNVGPNPSGQVGTYGTTDFLIDPTNSGVVYLGTSQLGIWKTTNCGADWVHINTGNKGTDVNGGSVAGSLLDAGRQWTMSMDPTNSQTLYATAGYGAGGIFRSTDGGVDWSQILPDSISSQTQYAGFIEKLTMDPSNHLHLLASFHTMCIGTALPGAPVVDNSNNVSVVSTTQSTPTGTSTNYQGWGCLAETSDGGTTWSLTTSAYPWVNSDGPGQTMVDATTWFYGTNGSNGLWRTTTGGVSMNGVPAWTEVSYYGAGGASQPLTAAIGSVYVAQDGSFYSGGNYSIVHSTDGINWTQLSGEYAPALGSENGSSPIVDTGTTVYITGSGSNWSAPVSTVTGYTSTSPTTSIFAKLTSPAQSAGGLWIKYDPSNHLLYTSNNLGGLWRVKTQ
jgi:hypothetical protein